MEWKNSNSLNMKKFIDYLSYRQSDGLFSMILIRVMTGSIFLWEGILKFVYANQGIGRFTKLGIPYMANIIGVLEIAGGLLIIVGLFSRITSIILAGEMLVAILLTKVTLYLGVSPLPPPCVPPVQGIWAFLHEVRTDYALLVTSLFIAIEGPGVVSLDYWRKKNFQSSVRVY